MSDEKVNEMPESWQLVSLEDLVLSPKSDIVDGPFGSNLKATEYVDSGVPIIRLQNIARNEFLLKNLRYISEDKATRLSRHSFIRGDIVVSKLGDPLGKACIVPDSMQHGIIVADVVRVRLPENILSKLAVMYALNSETVRSQLSRLTKGTTRPRVNLGHIRAVRVPLAPRDEQGRIVNEIEKQFTRLDAAVVALKRVQANLKRYRAAMLKAACEGRLVPTEAEVACKEGRSYETGEQLLVRILKERRAKWDADQFTRMHAAGKPPRDDDWQKKYGEPARPATSGLPPLPEGWGWATLEQLSSVITSGSRGWAEYYAAQGPLFIRAQDIKTDKLVLADVAHVKVPEGAEGQRTRVHSNDLLVTITGANVTKTAIADVGSSEAYVSQHVGLVRPVMSAASVYLYFWIVSPAHGRKILEKAAYGAGKPGLNLDNLRELPVALPPVAEQLRVVSAIASQISTIEDADMTLQQGIQRADRLRQAILKRAFEGKLVPHDPDDEPASVLLGRIRAERSKIASVRKGGKKDSRKKMPRAVTTVV